jgi:hypothetical protein
VIALRRLGSVLFCAWIGAWIARAAFHWVLDVSRTWEVAAVVAAAAIGGVLGLAAAIEKEAELEPAPPSWSASSPPRSAGCLRRDSSAVIFPLWQRRSRCWLSG